MTKRERKLFRVVMAAWFPLFGERPTYDEWCAAFDELFPATTD